MLYLKQNLIAYCVAVLYVLVKIKGLRYIVIRPFMKDSLNNIVISEPAVFLYYWKRLKILKRCVIINGMKLLFDYFSITNNIVSLV